jgi:uncharacterized protein (TIGR03437 family)
MDIDPVAPRLFTLSDGTTAAAAVQQVKADGSESYELVQGPIDLGPPGDNAFLILFGTGIRGGTGVRSATARIGNQDATVMFTGEQGGFDGLDQVNLRLPRSLMAAGQVKSR